MELLDIVDRNDAVVGSTDKATAHASKQLHRVAAVFVFRKQGELYVQVHKLSGGLYDHSVGGHVSKGETYAQGAAREAREELGIIQPLTHLTTFYSDEGTHLHMFGLFECVAKSGWKFYPSEEVDEIIPMRLEAIWSLMNEKPGIFTNGFMNTMREYRKIKGL